MRVCMDVRMYCLRVKGVGVIPYGWFCENRWHKYA